MALPRTDALLEQAAHADTREDALALAGEAVAAELLDVMKASGLSKAEQTVAALERAGLARLLAESLAAGRVRYTRVTAELERLRRALIDRSLSANDIKFGILAFDETAQRLSLVAGKAGGFEYPAVQNRARDSLITFARSLHR